MKTTRNIQHQQNCITDTWTFFVCLKLGRQLLGVETAILGAAVADFSTTKSLHKASTETSLIRCSKFKNNQYFTHWVGISCYPYLNTQLFFLLVFSVQSGFQVKPSCKTSRFILTAIHFEIYFCCRYLVRTQLVFFFCFLFLAWPYSPHAEHLILDVETMKNDFG